MLTFLRPVLEGQGDWDEVSELVRKMLDHGNSAKRQLWAFAQSGRLEDVIDLILEGDLPGTLTAGSPSHFPLVQQASMTAVSLRMMRFPGHVLSDI